VTDEPKQGRHAWVPESAVGDRRLGPVTPFVVYSCFLLFADKDGFCRPAVSSIARKLGITRPAVHAHLKLLISVGLVKKFPTLRSDGGKATNRYWVARDGIAAPMSAGLTSPCLSGLQARVSPTDIPMSVGLTCIKNRPIEEKMTLPPAHEREARGSSIDPEGEDTDASGGRDCQAASPRRPSLPSLPVDGNANLWAGFDAWQPNAANLDLAAENVPELRNPIDLKIADRFEDCRNQSRVGPGGLALGSIQGEGRLKPPRGARSDRGPVIIILSELAPDNKTDRGGQSRQINDLMSLGRSLSSEGGMDQLPAVLPDLSELGERAAAFARSAIAANTQRAYRADWADFLDWCQSVGRTPLPAAPITVGAYLSDRSGILKVSTLNRRVAAIASMHRTAGHGLDTNHPAIAQVLAGIRRTYGTHQQAKTAILTDDLRRMVRALPATSLWGLRDRAVLLIGFAGALRRSELAALDLVDIHVNADGVEILIRRGKTDQEGVGRELGIPRSKRSATCPVAALEAWLDVVKSPVHLSDGPLFRAIDSGRLTKRRLQGEAIAEIVKRAAARIGIDPKTVAGHSLRSGFCTSAARGGADLSFIMQQTGHKSADVARRYVQRGQLLSNPASKAVRL
jgi:site-specific recombinase XerD